MEGYRWEPYWVFMVRLTEIPEPPPVREPPAADAVQAEARRLWWRFQKLSNRMEEREHRQDRRGRRPR
jgi:hypothetical protein